MKELKSGKVNTPNIWLCTVYLIIGSALGTFAFYLYISYALGDGFVGVLSKAHGVVIQAAQETAFTKEDQEALADLVKNGHVLTQGQLIETMAQFYSDIINILITVIAALGVLGFLYVKGISKHEAQTIAAEEAQRYTDTKWFKQEIIDGVHKETSEYISGMQKDLEELLGQVPDQLVDSIEAAIVNLERLEQRMAIIENEISKDDMSEEEGSDINLEK